MSSDATETSNGRRRCEGRVEQDCVSGYCVFKIAAPRFNDAILWTALVTLWWKAGWLAGLAVIKCTCTNKTGNKKKSSKLSRILALQQASWN
mmetsp:Transcript_41448/g.163194  ORF Transcript_41448/g.163194 Transcript_41448/m.163194 type:complete len:92 (-) Transcript_41448:2286-2561(-)